MQTGNLFDRKQTNEMRVYEPMMRAYTVNQG